MSLTLSDLHLVGSGALVSGTLSTAGVTPASGLGTGGFTLTIAGGAANVSAWAIDGTLLLLSLDATVASGAVAAISYDATVGSLADALANALASFSGLAIDTSSPSTPILESIRQNLLTVLATVTTSNGYSGTLAVQSVSRWGNTTADLDTIVEQGSETVLGENDPDGSLGHDTYVQDFLIFVHIQEPAETGIAYDARCNAVVADVRKAVMADLTRGGFAYRTEKFPTALFTDAHANVGGVTVPFKVHYRTLLDDPFHQ